MNHLDTTVTDDNRSRYAIFCIDDDPFIKRLISRVFRKSNFDVRTMSTAEAA